MFQKTQVELLKSRFVLGKALSDPNVANLPVVLKQRDAAEWLADQLTLTFIGEVLYIELQGDDPQEVVKLVNAVTDAYIEGVVNEEQPSTPSAPRRAHEDIRDQLDREMEDHKKARDELAERAGSNDRETVEYRNQLAMERASRAEHELRNLRIQLRDARIDLATLQAPAPQGPTPAEGRDDRRRGEEDRAGRRGATGSGPDDPGLQPSRDRAE